MARSTPNKWINSARNSTSWIDAKCFTARRTRPYTALHPEAMTPLLAAVAMMAAAAVPPAAPQATASPKAPPEFGAAITVVTLPVFVTDKQGRAVAGLTSDDFA